MATKTRPCIVLYKATGNPREYAINQWAWRYYVLPCLLNFIQVIKMAIDLVMLWYLRCGKNLGVGTANQRAKYMTRKLEYTYFVTMN